MMAGAAAFETAIIIFYSFLIHIRRTPFYVILVYVG